MAQIYDSTHSGQQVDAAVDAALTTIPNQLTQIGLKVDKLEQEVIYDVSANNNGATFASLSTLLSDGNLSTLIPIAVRSGGMSIRFVQTSDNKYVQYSYMCTDVTTAATFTNVANWQGVDDVPKDFSNNLVESGGVAVLMPSTDEIVTESYSMEVGGYDINGTYNDYAPKRFRNHHPLLLNNLMKTISVASGYKINLFGNNSGYGSDLSYISEGTSIDLSTINYKYLFIVGARNDDAPISNVDDLENIVTIQRIERTLIPCASKASVDTLGGVVAGNSSDINTIEESLPKEIIETDVYYGVEVGAYNTNGTYNDYSSKRFRNHLPIEVTDNLQLINCATGYEFTIWGNDEGLGHNLTMVMERWGSTFSLNNFQYKYMFVIGKREDDGDITNADNLSQIVSLHGIFPAGNIIPSAPNSEVEELKKKIKNIIIVDAQGGGDYTSLQDAIDNAGDSASTPKTILVLPGEYIMPTYDASTRYKGNNRYLSIIGIDKNNCIIRNDVGYYRTSGGYIDNAPLKLAGNVYVSNLTIISTDANYPTDAEENRHMAYCIHLDFTAPQNSICEINNCVLVNNHFSCIGFGLRTNYTIKIVNCELTTTMHERNGLYDYGTLYGHDGYETSTSEITQHLFVKDCVITNTNGYYGIKYLNAYDGLADMTLVNNVVDVPTGSGFSIPSQVSLTKKCFGNNKDNMNYTS